MERTLDRVSEDVGFIASSIIYYGITWTNSFNFLSQSFPIWRAEKGILVLLIKNDYFKDQIWRGI